MRSNCADHDGHSSVPMSASYHQAMGSISRRYCWWSSVISIFTWRGYCSWDGQTEILQQDIYDVGCLIDHHRPNQVNFYTRIRLVLVGFCHGTVPQSIGDTARRNCPALPLQPDGQISTTVRKAKTGGFVLLQTELGVDLGLERIQWIISFIILKLLSLSEGN